MRKKLFLAAIALIGLSFSSCENKPKPAGPAAVQIEIGDKTLETIAVTFTPNSNSVSFEFAIGLESDLAAFDDGTLDGIVKVDNGDVKNHTFENLMDGAEYVVFAAAVNADGVRGATESMLASTNAASEAEIKVTINNLTIPILDVTFKPNSLCGEDYHVFIVSEEVWGWMLEEDTYEGRLAALQDFIDMGMTTQYSGATTDKLILNGYADYESLLLIMFYDLNGDPIYKELEFTSPSLNTSLTLPSPIEMATVSVTETAASISFTPGDNTVGFYYALFTKANYNEVLAAGERRTDGLSVEDHVKEYIAFWGTTSLEAVTDTWTNQPSGTEFVVVAAPFNGNGADYQYGYGALATYEFSTLGTAAVAPNKAPLMEQNEKRAIRNKLMGLKK